MSPQKPCVMPGSHQQNPHIRVQCVSQALCASFEVPPLSSLGYIWSWKEETRGSRPSLLVGTSFPIWATPLLNVQGLRRSLVRRLPISSGLETG